MLRRDEGGEGKIILNNKFVSVTERGLGDPILLLHGYLSCKESFYYQLAALESAGYRAVAPDMPSFGASDKTEEPWSVGDYAEWLYSFIEVKNLYGAHILAHSFGARVAFKLLAGENDIAGKLIITGGAGLVKPRSAAYMRQVKRYRRIKKLFPRYAEKHFGSSEYRTLPPVMRESYKLIVNEDLRDFAAKIKNPTLLIYGRQDGVTPLAEEGAEFNRLIGGSRLRAIDGGHFCFSENYVEFNRLMVSFLGGEEV